MKKALTLIIALLCLSARADYYVFETTSIGLDSTMCYSRPYVGSAINHSEEIAVGQLMPRIFVVPGQNQWMTFNAVWLPTGNSVTFFNGIFFESFGPYNKYALLFFQSDGVHVHLNPRIYSSPWWVPCEDFYVWEQTIISWRSYDP